MVSPVPLEYYDREGTGRVRAALALALLLLALPGHAQDIEPRRWSHLPIGSNFLGGAYAYTTGDIFLDPVLRIEDAEFNLHTVAAKYIRSFELLGKSARIDHHPGLAERPMVGFAQRRARQRRRATDGRTPPCVSR